MCTSARSSDLKGKSLTQSVKLEALGPAKKDKEFDVLDLEHTLQRHRDQKGRGQICQSILGYQTG